MLPTYPDEQLATLEPEALIELMVRDEDRVPRNVIDACARLGEPMVACLEELIGIGAFWREDASSGEWWLGLHAAMILGLVPGERAGLALAALMHRMAVAEDDSPDDWLAAYWPALFANKPGSTLTGVRKLAADSRAGWYGRAHGMDVIVAAAERQGGGALEEALEWVAGIARDEQEERELRLLAGNLLLDFPRERHRSLVDDLAQRQGAFGVHFSEKDVRRAYSAGSCEPEWHRFDDPWDFYAPQTIAERQERWREEEAQDEKVSIPILRAAAKVGRNDPCPCGSGRKYKKCCLPGAPVAGGGQAALP